MDAEIDPPDGVSPRRTSPWGALAGLMAWVGVVVAGLAVSPTERSGVGASPFYGRWDVHDLAGLVPAFLLAAAVVWAWPVVSARRRVGWLAAVSGLASVVWAVALALSGGVDRLWTPLADKYGYLGVAPELDAHQFLRTFVDRVGTYPTHVKGHPPGMPVVLRALDGVGLGGPRWAAVVMLVVWALGVGAVVIAVDAVADRSWAQRVSGPVAFLPAVVFVATTYDAFFAGVMAVAIALLVVAARSHGPRSDALAVAGGLLAGFALHLSYGLVPLGLVPLVVIVRYRRVRVAALAAVGVAAVFGAFVASGFWWLDGLHATRGFYDEGISQFRPYGLFVFVVNPAALALCLGPFVASGAGRDWLRRSAPDPVALVSMAALAAVLVADLSGLSNGETERIWLPFMPWLAIAAATKGRADGQRVQLAVLLAIGLAIQATLVTPW